MGWPHNYCFSIRQGFDEPQKTSQFSKQLEQHLELNHRSYTNHSTEYKYWINIFLLTAYVTVSFQVIGLLNYTNNIARHVLAEFLRNISCFSLL